MQDLRFAIRSLRAAPVVTVVAVLSLALGIGANTAIFSLVDGLLLRPLPVAAPERLAVVSDARSAPRGIPAAWTYPVWEQIRKRADAFGGACAWWTERLSLTPHGGESEPVDTMWVSGRYFDTLGVRALLGRTIAPHDDAPGTPDGAVAVISYEFWQSRLTGAAGAIGEPILIEGVPFTIVGIAPPGFFGAEVGRTFDVALPINAEPLIRGAQSRIRPDAGFFALTILLRLGPGQSMADAERILRGAQPQIKAASVPPRLPPPLQKEFLREPMTLLPAATGISRLRVAYERPLVAILIVVGLVLLIACANIANLQLARAIARRHELSVRVALGAPRWRLARESLIESVLLAFSGAALGLLFATWSSRLLVEQLSTDVNRVHLDLSLDWRVLGFAAGTGVATTLLFGLMAALRAATAAPGDALKDQGRTSAGARTRLSNSVIVLQVALSVVIVVAAGLFVRSFEKLATVPLGFDSGRVLLVNVNVARTAVAPADRPAFVDRLVREVDAVPGVARAAASLITPIQGLGLLDMVHTSGVPLSFEPMTNGQLGRQMTYANILTPGWFAAYGATIRNGRDFDEHDDAGAPKVAIVNDAFIRKFLAGKAALGATVEFENPAGPVAKTIVGIVGDETYNQLRARDVPIEYTPLAQLTRFAGQTPADYTISVRAATGSPMLLVRAVGAALSTVDSRLEFSFRPLADQVSASMAQERLTAILSAFFGALALLLAGLGLFGTTAYAVACRRTEIGIRMALGASGPGVVRLVVGRTVLLVAVGIVIGAGASVWASKFVTALLFGVTGRDPATLVVAAAALVAIGAAASWLPARRASRLDPATILREQ